MMWLLIALHVSLIWSGARVAQAQSSLTAPSNPAYLNSSSNLGAGPIVRLPTVSIAEFTFFGEYETQTLLPNGDTPRDAITRLAQTMSHRDDRAPASAQYYNYDGAGSSVTASVINFVGHSSLRWSDVAAVLESLADDVLTDEWKQVIRSTLRLSIFHLGSHDVDLRIFPSELGPQSTISRGLKNTFPTTLKLRPLARGPDPIPKLIGLLALDTVIARYKKRQPSSSDPIPEGHSVLDDQLPYFFEMVFQAREGAPWPKFGKRDVVQIMGNIRDHFQEKGEVEAFVGIVVYDDPVWGTIDIAKVKFYRRLMPALGGEETDAWSCEVGRTCDESYRSAGNATGVSLSSNGSASSQPPVLSAGENLVEVF